jgi:hypothetical protein
MESQKKASAYADALSYFICPLRERYGLTIAAGYLVYSAAYVLVKLLVA